MQKLYSFNAVYRTASGRLTYAFGVTRDTSPEGLERVLRQSGRRKIITDLQASFFPVEETT